MKSAASKEQQLYTYMPAEPSPPEGLATEDELSGFDSSLSSTSAEAHIHIGH